MRKEETDYSLYLVTDSGMVPAESTFESQVEQAILNGASIVQLREKRQLTLEFVHRAQNLLYLTRKSGIPLIINDRLDIALAVNADGVHLGQDDMPASVVRAHLGPDKIIGVTCSTVEEVKQVCEEGIADYVGLGTAYKTSTKKDVTFTEGLGPFGMKKMLAQLKKHNQTREKKIKCVVIGGVNHSNVQNLLYHSAVRGQNFDGVAVVSCIMASKRAGNATSELLGKIKSLPAWTHSYTLERKGCCPQKQKVAAMMDSSPLMHHITNNVVKNFSANVSLAIGGSPIMSEFDEEFEELVSNIPNISLVLNLGTPAQGQMEIFKSAILVYNRFGRHIVFDPVACGATNARLRCCLELLSTGHMSVMKGNFGEILSIWKSIVCRNDGVAQAPTMRGVDSVSESSDSEILTIGKQVALELRNIVVITGKVNYIFDGIERGSQLYDINTSEDDVIVEKIAGGHELMGSITGTGCSLGSTIAAFLASKADGYKNNQFDLFQAVVGAVTLYNDAGSLAGRETATPGTFVNKFLDALYTLTHQ